jgi:hypothetical protein
VPQIVSPDDGSWQPTAAVVAEITAAVGEQRSGAAPFDAGPFDAGPFDVVITGRTGPDEPAQAQDTTGAIAAAGATWWLEGFRPQPGEQAAALRRIEDGPPR